MNKYSKQVKSTFSGNLLKKFKAFLDKSGLREGEALRFFVTQGFSHIENGTLELPNKK